MNPSLDLRGLAEPRRLAALGAVLATLLVTEAFATRSVLTVGLDALLFAVFVLVAPGNYRTLWPQGRAGQLAYGLLGVGSVALVALVVAWLSPRWTYVIDPGSLAVLVVLFLVGGWGLGRDVDLTEHAAVLTREAERRELETHQAQLEAQRAHLETRRAQLEAREATLTAEQNALLAQRAQLDPHFLFNVLNAIAEYCQRDPEIAERATLALASMLRTMLEATRAPWWPIETELALARSVTELYAMRDRARYRFRLAWPALEGVAIPPLILLPVIENAITHGPGADHDGEVSMTVTRAGASVEIVIENPGAYAGPREGGEGLSLIRRRLALAYGDAARFSIEPRGAGTLAIVSLPATPPGGDA